jgi:hypothetical protein
MIVSSPSAPAPGLRQAPDGGPPLREDEAVPMPGAISFGDFLANLNPLHHIPVVGWVYRQITGETVNPAFRALGGFLFGGPVGAIIAAVGAMAESLFSGSPDSGAGGVVAVAPPRPGEVAVAAAFAEGAATQRGEAGPLAEAGAAADGHALAARLGARPYRAPPEAALPPLAAVRPAGESDFAERMMRGLDAYERTLRLRSSGA